MIRNALNNEVTEFSRGIIAEWNDYGYTDISFVWVPASRMSNRSHGFYSLHLDGEPIGEIEKCTCCGHYHAVIGGNVHDEDYCSDCGKKR
jgi:hypothetical protein